MRLKEITRAVSYINLRPSQFKNASLDKMKAEEEVLINVLLTYLGREIKEKDFKHCNKIWFRENIYNYTFVYKSTALGDVFMTPLTTTGFTIEFKPRI